MLLSELIIQYLLMLCKNHLPGFSEVLAVAQCSNYGHVCIGLCLDVSLG